MKQFFSIFNSFILDVFYVAESACLKQSRERMWNIKKKISMFS